MSVVDLILKSREQEIYLENTYEGCAVRYTTNGKYYVKFPGKLEYQVWQSKPRDLAPGELAMFEDRDIIFDPLMDGIELTKEEYYNY